MERDAGAEQALAALRLGHTLTRPQLATLSGVSVATIIKAEDGQPVREATAAALAQVLGAEVYGAVVIRDTPLRTPDPSTAVARARLDRGWTQLEAARHIGVSADVLRRAEAGKGVHPANARKIALAFGLDTFDVLPPRKANGDSAAA